MALYDLRLEEDHFWNMTPIEFDYLVKRYILEEQRFDRRVALISYIIASTSPNIKRGKKYKIDDFMLHDYGHPQGKKAEWLNTLTTLRSQLSQLKK